MTRLNPATTPRLRGALIALGALTVLVTWLEFFLFGTISRSQSWAL